MNTAQMPRVLEKGLAFKTKLRNGEQLSGAWSTLGSAEVAFLMARAGLDYIIIDLEHGKGGVDTVRDQSLALLSLDCAIVVRLPDHQVGSIKRILDAGANAILAPSVDKRAQGDAILRAALFAPAGERGVAVGAIPAADYGFMPQSYFDNANDALTCIFQVETPEALRNLNDMVQDDRVDAFFVGPNDLSTALGGFRDYKSPTFQEAMQRFETTVSAAGKALGCLPYPGRNTDDLFEQGFQLAPSGSDHGFIKEGAARVAQK